MTPRIFNITLFLFALGTILLFSAAALVLNPLFWVAMWLVKG